MLISYNILNHLRFNFGTTCRLLRGIIALAEDPPTREEAKVAYETPVEPEATEYVSSGRLPVFMRYEDAPDPSEVDCNLIRFCKRVFFSVSN